MRVRARALGHARSQVIAEATPASLVARNLLISPVGGSLAQLASRGQATKAQPHHAKAREQPAAQRALAAVPQRACLIGRGHDGVHMKHRMRGVKGRMSPGFLASLRSSKPGRVGSGIPNEVA